MQNEFVVGREEALGDYGLDRLTFRVCRSSIPAQKQPSYTPLTRYCGLRESETLQGDIGSRSGFVHEVLPSC